MVDVALIIFMVLTIILLFVSMVLSAMASNQASKGSQKCKEDCHKYSMWSALIAGLSVALIVIGLIIYIYTSRHHVAQAASEMLQKHGAKLGRYGARSKSA